MNEKLKWKVIYVSSRQEKKVFERLQKLGITCFLPLTKKLRQWSDRKKWVEFPLFNGYLFVKPNALQRDKILEDHEVVAYVRYNGGDAIVQDKEIDTIKSILESGYSLETINKPDDFEVGNQVTIKEGPLKGSVVNIIRRNSKEYFLVSFDTLGHSIKVELPFNVFEIYNK
jgi:transcription antitermination factor NusG